MPDSRIPSGSVNQYAKAEEALRTIEGRFNFPPGSLEAEKFASAYAVVADGFVEPTAAEFDDLARAIAKFGGSLQNAPTEPIREFRLFLANPFNLPSAALRRRLSDHYSALAAVYGIAEGDETAANARRISDALGNQNQVDVDNQSLNSLQMISGLSKIVGQETTTKALINSVSLKWDRASGKSVLMVPDGFRTLVRILYEMKVADPSPPQTVQTTWRINSLNSLLQNGQTDLVRRLLAIAETLRWSRKNRVIDTLIDVSVRTPPVNTPMMELVSEMVKLMEGVMEGTERTRNRSIGMPRGYSQDSWLDHSVSSKRPFKRLHALVKEWKAQMGVSDVGTGGGGSPTVAGSGPAQLWMPQAGMLQAAPVFNPAMIAMGGIQTMMVNPAMSVAPVLV